MPTYQYRCEECDRPFDRVERMEEHGRTPPACPECGGRRVHQELAPFFAKTARKS
jgi:putative FmdB family regulatory protein